MSKELSERFSDKFEEDRKKLLAQAGMLPEDTEDLYKDFRDDADEGMPQYQNNEPDLDGGDVEGFDIERFPDGEYYDQYEGHNIRQEEEELFPGGPLLSEIEIWKKQYEHHGHRIVITEIGDDVFVFRTLNRYEYKQIVAIPNSNPITREEVFCKTCTLWPPMNYQSMTQGKGGVPSTLAQVIMEHSGFVREWEAKIL